MPPSPLTTTIVQSTILNAISNLFAQLIDQYKNKNDQPFTFTLNTLALLQFITYGIIIVPINVAWQRWLEVTYPGFLFSSGNPTSGHASSPSSSSVSLPLSVSTSAPEKPRGSGSGSGSGSRSGTEVVEVKEKFVPLARAPTWTPAKSSQPSAKRHRILNFTMKFMLDQTVGGVMNIILFVVLINLLKGASVARCVELVGEDFMPIFMARLKFRPVVSTLMYTVVPLERRVVFGSACSVVWGIYLSLYAAV